MIRAVLFDLDGVLVDSREAWLRVLNAAAHAWGLPDVPRADFLATFGQGVEADAAQFFPGHSGDEVSDFYDAHFPAYLAHVSEEPGARDLLAALAERRLPAAVVTNTPPELARRIVDAVGLRADLVLGAGGDLREKPAPDLLQRACERLAVAAPGAVMVGDSAYDRLAARAAGIRFAGYGLEGDLRLERLSDLLDCLDGG